MSISNFFCDNITYWDFLELQFHALCLQSSPLFYRADSACWFGLVTYCNLIDCRLPGTEMASYWAKTIRFRLRLWSMAQLFGVDWRYTTFWLLMLANMASWQRMTSVIWTWWYLLQSMVSTLFQLIYQLVFDHLSSAASYVCQMQIIHLFYTGWLFSCV